MAVVLHQVHYDTHSDYRVDFNGSVIFTTVTNNSIVINNWLEYTLGQHLYCLRRLVVGLEVQWNSRSDQAATLDICIGRRCLIIQLVHCVSVPIFLRVFLTNANFTFVGIRNHLHGPRLGRGPHNLELAIDPPLDLSQHAAGANGQSLSNSSFRQIVYECLGIRGLNLEEFVGLRRSNWEASVLSRPQVAQATMRAYVSFLIGTRIRAWNINANP